MGDRRPLQGCCALVDYDQSDAGCEEREAQRTNATRRASCKGAIRGAGRTAHESDDEKLSSDSHGQPFELEHGSGYRMASREDSVKSASARGAFGGAEASRYPCRETESISQR